MFDNIVLEREIKMEKNSKKNLLIIVLGVIIILLTCFIVYDKVLKQRIISENTITKEKNQTYTKYSLDYNNDICMDVHSVNPYIGSTGNQDSYEIIIKNLPVKNLYVGTGEIVNVELTFMMNYLDGQDEIYLSDKLIYSSIPNGIESLVSICASNGNLIILLGSLEGTGKTIIIPTDTSAYIVNQKFTQFENEKLVFETEFVQLDEDDKYYMYNDVIDFSLSATEKYYRINKNIFSCSKLSEKQNDFSITSYSDAESLCNGSWQQ